MEAIYSNYSKSSERACQRRGFLTSLEQFRFSGSRRPGKGNVIRRGGAERFLLRTELAVRFRGQDLNDCLLRAADAHIRRHSCHGVRDWVLFHP